MSDQTLKGILLAFAAFAAYAWSDASVKLIEGQISPIRSAFFGALFGLIALPFIRKRNDRWVDVVKTTNRPLWIIRFLPPVRVPSAASPLSPIFPWPKPSR